MAILIPFLHLSKGAQNGNTVQENHRGAESDIHGSVVLNAMSDDGSSIMIRQLVLKESSLWVVGRNVTTKGLNKVRPMALRTRQCSIHFTSRARLVVSWFAPACLKYHYNVINAIPRRNLCQEIFCVCSRYVLFVKICDTRCRISAWKE